MIIRQYGIEYERLKESDIELVRYWRNQSFIRETMQFNSIITKEMQLEWFKRINNAFNYYFLIIVNNEKIGLINCKDSNINSRTAEGGIFIWNKNYWGTHYPVLASLTTLQCVFEVFESGNNSIITILKNNKPALIYNKLLGYEIYAEDEKTYKLQLTKEKYFLKTIKYKRAAEILSNGSSKIEIIAEKSELLSDEINRYLENQ